MQAVLNVAWDKLLPAMQASATLPADDAAREKLQERLKRLALKPQEGPAASASAAEVWGKKYAFPENRRKLESVTLEKGAEDGAATIVARIDGAERRIECARGAWKKGRSGWGALPEQPVAASGAWTAGDTYTARACFYETPFIVTVTLKFAGDELHCTSESNVGFGPTKEPTLVGKAE
jgi:hypothetical protein